MNNHFNTSAVWEDRIHSRPAVPAQPQVRPAHPPKDLFPSALRETEWALRRTFDLLCAVAGLLVLFPLLAAVGLAIKLEDGGPVFYSHPRIGQGFRPFGLLKFRSMVPRADRFGGPVTVSGDPRVTRVGRLLRRTKLDELPQLINVLKGDMALVGARPEVERYVKMFRPEYTFLLADRPGITDPAAIAFRHEEELLNAANVEQRYVSHILPGKLALSTEYAQRRTFPSDIAVLARTVGVIFHRSTNGHGQLNPKNP